MYAADIRHNNPALHEKLAAIYKMRGSKPGIDLTIRQDYIDLLAALGNPHRNLPPVIHVAGTNGKGSTIAFMAAILACAGYSVHTYTSPHIRHFNERIVLAGNSIDDNNLETLLDKVLSHAAEKDVTFFEVTTALAFLAFARAPADIVLLETGLGGRLDCTNVIEQPAATIITSIGYDHMEFLGSTLAAIAGEKAGIIKQGSPCFTPAALPSEAMRALKEKAQEKKAMLHTVKPLGDNSKLGLAGGHQRENAALAAACLQALPDFNIDDKAVEAGLQSAHWPGRLQRLADPAPGCELWFDGGHNESAGRALAAQAAAWKKQDEKPLTIILGMMKHKNPAAFIKPLAPYIDALYTVGIAGEEHAFAASELAAALSALHEDVNPVLSLQSAIERAAKQKQRILICGSLYLLQCPSNNN